MIWMDMERKLQDFFEGGALPAVLSVDRRHYDETKYKFLMHGHEAICEITYVYEGAGIYRQGKRSLSGDCGGYSAVQYGRAARDPSR